MKHISSSIFMCQHCDCSPPFIDELIVVFIRCRGNCIPDSCISGTSSPPRCANLSINHFGDCWWLNRLPQETIVGGRRRWLGGWLRGLKMYDGSASLMSIIINIDATTILLIYHRLNDTLLQLCETPPFEPFDEQHWNCIFFTDVMPGKFIAKEEFIHIGEIASDILRCRIE